MMMSRNAPATPAPAPRPGAAPRRCLACNESFASGGPHERICPGCKEGEDWRDGVALCKGHIAW
jgi:hypothetical protein